MFSNIGTVNSENADLINIDRGSDSMSMHLDVGGKRELMAACTIPTLVNTRPIKAGEILLMDSHETTKQVPMLKYEQDIIVKKPKLAVLDAELCDDTGGEGGSETAGEQEAVTGGVKPRAKNSTTKAKDGKGGKKGKGGGTSKFRGAKK